MNKSILTFITYAFSIFSSICVAQNKPVTIRVDPSFALGGTPTGLIDSIIYIPLETNKSSLLGRITQLEITDDFFIILDTDTKCILFFKRDGRFDHKIKLKGTTARFIINKQKRELTYAVIGKDRSDRFAYRYSFEGVELLKTPVAPEIEKRKRYEYLYDTYIFPNQDLVVAQGYPFKQDFEDPSRAKAWLTFHHDSGSNPPFATALDFKPDLQYDFGNWTANNGPFYYSGAEDFVLFAKPYDYSIYKVSVSGTVDTLYKLIFPLQNAVPVDFMTNPQYNEKRIEYFNANIDKIYFLENCYQTGNYLFFKLNTQNADKRKDYDNLYNLNTGQLTSYLRLASDKKSYELPLFDDSFSGFIAFDGKFLYRPISSLEMFENYQANRKKKIKYPENLKRYFSKGNSKDNPVLVSVKFNNN